MKTDQEERQWLKKLIRAKGKKNLMIGLCCLGIAAISIPFVRLSVEAAGKNAKEYMNKTQPGSFDRDAGRMQNTPNILTVLLTGGICAGGTLVGTIFILVGTSQFLLPNPRYAKSPKNAAINFCIGTHLFKDNTLLDSLSAWMQIHPNYRSTWTSYEAFINHWLKYPNILMVSGSKIVKTTVSGDTPKAVVSVECSDPTMTILVDVTKEGKYWFVSKAARKKA